MANAPIERLIDPADPGFLHDPYPALALARAAGELHLHPAMGRGGEGMLLAVSHRACSALLRHRRLGRIWVDAAPADAFTAFNLLHRNSLLETEGDRHARLRSLVSAAFGRGHVQRLEPTVRRIARSLVDALAGRIAEQGSGDLVAEVAEPLPVAVICGLLGVPDTDLALLTGWSNAIVKMYEYGLGPAQRRAAETAAAEFVEYLEALAADRRDRPGDDLISDLVGVRDGGERLSGDELVGTAALLLMAGHEATVNAIGNGVRALLAHPAQLDRLRADRTLLPTAAEELLRFDSPLQLFERTVVADTELVGTPVRAGQRVAALLGAAARDPAVFRAPDVLNVGRQPNPHLGFGLGVHYCLGAPLARLELVAVLDTLLDRLPGLCAAGPAVRRPEFVIRGLRSLPVTHHPVGGG